MKRLTQILLILVYPLFTQGQELDTSNFDNLNTIKVFSGQNDNKKIATCRPCVVKTYNSKKNLILEAVQYSDCIVGWFKKFDEKGNLIKTGQFIPALNDSSNYCSLQHGKWFFISWRGDTLYTETWDKGVFLNQEPKLKKVDVWDVEFILDNQVLQRNSVTTSELGRITVSPKYKNDQRPNGILLKCTLLSWGQGSIHRKIKGTSLSSIDFIQLIENNGFSNSKDLYIEIEVLIDNETVFIKHLDITD